MKTLKAEVQHLEEELSELRGEKETLEKVRRSTTLMPDAKIPLFLQTVTSHKKKMSSLKRKHEEEMEDVKTGHETELNQLRDRLRKEKHSASTAISDQVTAVERELEAQWKERCERAVNQADERWKRKYSDLQDDYQQLQNELTQTKNKVCVFMCVCMCVCGMVHV